VSGYRRSTLAGRTLRSVTTRERASLLLVLLGAVAVLVAAAAYGGWEAALAVAGVLMLGGGVLLGLDGPTEVIALAPGEEL
jgi:predicted phage tail protein